MRKGFVYVVAIIDWYSRLVLSWRLSKTMDPDLCVEALRDAFRLGKPEISNTDQGSQFTPADFVNCLQDHGVKVSMDGRVRWMDNVMVERLWRSLKYNKGSLAQADSVGIIAPVLIMPLPGILSIHEDVVVAPDMVSVGSNVALTDHA